MENFLVNTTTYTPGRYRAEIIDQGFFESNSKGTPGFFLQLKILSRCGPGGELQECPQFERTYEQYLANDTGARILYGDLKAIGFDVAELSRLDLDDSEAVHLVGQQIDVECRLEGYNGVVRERWGIPRPRKKLGLDAIRSVAAKFRQPPAGGAAA
jgi:hypothetical protein